MRLGAGVGGACSCRFWVNEESVIEEGERPRAGAGLGSLGGD